MANAVFNYFKQTVLMGSYNLESNVYCALVNNSYSGAIDIDNHKFWGDINGTYEISGSGYTAGGAALSSPAVTQDDTLDAGKFDATNWQIANATVTAAGAVLYNSSGSGVSADALIAFVDFGSDQSVTAGTFTIQWNANGILNQT